MDMTVIEVFYSKNDIREPRQIIRVIRPGTVNADDIRIGMHYHVPRKVRVVE